MIGRILLLEEVSVRTLQLALAAAGAIAAGVALAQSGADVVKSKGCVTCHAADEKKVGPSFKDIAAKHKGNSAAAAEITVRLKEGKGHPKAAASDAELKAAVEYVLSHK
jgi:cytochrome c